MNSREWNEISGQFPDIGIIITAMESKGASCVGHYLRNNMIYILE